MILHGCVFNIIGLQNTKASNRFMTPEPFEALVFHLYEKNTTLLTKH